jgi:hypothetical protein
MSKMWLMPNSTYKRPLQSFPEVDVVYERVIQRELIGYGVKEIEDQLDIFGTITLVSM